MAIISIHNFFPTEITTDTPNIAIGTTQINIKRHLEKV